ncbi:MAG: YfhO family protein [Gemmatimonadaceae bacterium]
MAEPALPFMRAAIVCALCTLALGYKALSGGFLVSPTSDQYSTGVPYRQFGTEVLRATGEFAQWNPLILGGIPYAAAGGAGDVFYPTFILRLLLPIDVAVTWSFLLHIFLAGLFTFGFVRALGFAFWPALFAGVAYMMSGQVASLVSPGHDGKIYVSALAPLLLWMIVRAVRDGRAWAWGMIALVTGLAILTPHNQMVYYLALLCIPFTIWMALRGGEERPPTPVATRRILIAGAAAALGVGIAALQFFPFYAYLDYGARGVARGYEYATSYSMAPEEMLHFNLPQFSGILDASWGRNFFKLHSEYVGAVVLLVAGLAFGAPGRRKDLWFWGITGLVATLVTLGGHTPFYRLWYLLPMMKVVRAPAMIFYIAQLAIAIFAAIGLERLLGQGVKRGYLLGWIAFAVLMLILAGGGVLTSIAHALASPQLYGRVEENTSAVIGGAARSFLFVALAAGAIWAGATGRISRMAVAAALVALAAADLWTIERRYFRFSPPASVVYASDPTIEYLQRLEEPGRVLILGVAGGGGPDPVLHGDAHVIHGIRAVTGHVGTEFQRWVELVGDKSPYPVVPPPNLFTREFRRLTNTRFWLTNAELPPEHPQLPGMRLIHRVGPVRNASGNEVWLYEFDERNPAAWVTPIYTEAPAEAIRATVMNPAFDVGRAALFDSSDAVQGQSVSNAPRALDLAARVQYVSPREIRVDLAGPAPEGSALIVSENWYPGWRATVDGRPASVARADYTFMGIPLTAGARHVELSFTDPVYVRGRLITLIALALTAGLIIGGLVLERRRRG